jgi:predicted HAD superfamily Cof-like phosphohydrolase
MYKQVLEFTKSTYNQALPLKPEKLNRKEIEFLVSMILSETNELLQTVCVDMEDCKETTLRCMNTDIKQEITKFNDDEEVCAEQADAMIDIIYYIMNSATKKSINLDNVFNEVHNANMNKRDPSTGKFIIRSDGKVIKPENWKPPNIKRVLFNSYQSSVKS